MIARFGSDDGGALRDGNALLGLILGLIARCVRRIVRVGGQWSGQHRHNGDASRQCVC